MTTAVLPPLTKKDFQTDQEVRWCPGCGDYAILSAVQAVFPELGIKRENFVVVSGIGCSSRFPYYMNTYGFHSIHGRAPAVATGIKVARPELEVWVATGDGDALAIGGNHTIHMLRRNVGIKVLLFNNRIYGLTKGQYSPTSEFHKMTKSTPYGSPDRPFNPVSLAIGAESTFVARSVDVFQAHLKDTLKHAAAHKGSAFIEILQNCNIFNDGAWFSITEKDARSEHVLQLEPIRAPLQCVFPRELAVLDRLQQGLVHGLHPVLLSHLHQAVDLVRLAFTDHGPDRRGAHQHLGTHGAAGTVALGDQLAKRLPDLESFLGCDHRLGFQKAHFTDR